MDRYSHHQGDPKTYVKLPCSRAKQIVDIRKTQIPIKGKGTEPSVPSLISHIVNSHLRCQSLPETAYRVTMDLPMMIEPALKTDYSIILGQVILNR